MPPIYLTPRAEEIVESVTANIVDAPLLIEVYGRWRATPSTSSPGGHGDLLDSVKELLGLTSPGAEEIEDLGRALNTLIQDAAHPLWQPWHSIKLAALRGGDRQKKLIALRHVTREDIKDKELTALLLRTLANDDEATAIAFADGFASHVNPSSDRELIQELLIGATEKERAHSPRSALYVMALHMFYEQCPGAAPEASIIEQLAEIASGRNAASFAATSDLMCLTIARTGDWSSLLGWLRSADARKSMFALIILTAADSAGIRTLREDRLELCGALKSLKRRLESLSAQLEPHEIEWIEKALHKALSYNCSQ